VSSTRLGNYDLIKPLASGGMAEVCAARDRTTGEVVIVKRMLPQFTSSPEFVEMFLDEGRTVALLRHPNVVRMLDFGFHGDLPYLAMEYLHGVDLRTLMRAVAKRGELLPLDLALGIVAALCAGLHHAHQARALDGRVLDIVHRDVSPQNLVITFDGGIKLIDFGIAKSRDRIHETRAGGLKGKVPYMSPEQIRATSVDHRTDIYAAGVVLYELVTGRRPYRADRRTAQGESGRMRGIVGHRIVKPAPVAPDLPFAVEEVLLRSLAPQPGHRYATAEEMQRALVRVAEELDQPFDVAALRTLVLTRFGERDRKWRQALQQDDELVTIIEASRREQDVHEDDHDPPSVVSGGMGSAAPGRFTPSWLSTCPPTATEQTAQPSSTRSTRSGTCPSSMSTSWPASSRPPTTSGAIGRSTAAPCRVTFGTITSPAPEASIAVSESFRRPISSP